MMFAISVILMFIESLIPPIATLPPGVKLGLSNIVIMYVVIYDNYKSSFIILLLKCLFVFLTRGLVASFISLSGGLFSVIIIILLLKYKKISYIIVSILGAIFHNVGQIIASIIILGTYSVLYYLPVLIISGIIMGFITGVILKVTIPAIKRLNLKERDV